MGWIEHHGRGYPFDREDADGNPIAAPMVLVCLACRSREKVLAKAEWHPADWWPRWRWDGDTPGPGDIVAYMVKE